MSMLKMTSGLITLKDAKYFYIIIIDVLVNSSFRFFLNIYVVGQSVAILNIFALSMRGLCIDVRL